MRLYRYILSPPARSKRSSESGFLTTILEGQGGTVPVLICGGRRRYRAFLINTVSRDPLSRLGCAKLTERGPPRLVAAKDKPLTSQRQKKRNQAPALRKFGEKFGPEGGKFLSGLDAHHPIPCLRLAIRSGWTFCLPLPPFFFAWEDRLSDHLVRNLSWKQA
jgi:hypothetical protein